MNMTLESMTEKIIDWVSDKKAENIVTIDIDPKIATYTDKIIICTGSSDLHIKAIANHIIDECKENKIKLLSKEGLDAGVWVLLDFGEVILHIFKEDLRNYYDLETLWAERDAQIKHIERTYA